MKRKRMSGLLAMTLAFSAVATPAVYAGTIDNAPTPKTAIVSKIAVDEIAKKKINVTHFIKGKKVELSVAAFVYNSEEDRKRIIDEAIKERKSEIWVTTKKYYLMADYRHLCSSRDYRSITKIEGQYKSNCGRDYDTFRITFDYSAFREETSVVLDYTDLEVLEKSMVNALLESQYRVEDEFIISVKNVPIKDFGYETYEAKNTLRGIVGRSCKRDIRQEVSTIRYDYVVRNDDIVDIVFKFDYSNASKKVILEALKKEKEILDSFKPDMSDYEKVKIIHDEIVKSAGYRDDGKNLKHRSTVAVFGSKKASKSSYALAFQRLATLAGIEAYDLGSWNLVKLGDNYYHLDTYKDENKRYSYFLLSDEEIKSKGSYVNTPNGRQNEYTWDETKFPKASVKFDKDKVLKEEKIIRDEKKAKESNSKVDTQSKVEEKK